MIVSHRIVSGGVHAATIDNTVTQNAHARRLGGARLVRRTAMIRTDYRVSASKTNNSRQGLHMRFIFPLMFIAGAAIGLFLPDTDRVFPFLLHRSIMTHSALIPLVGYLSFQRAPTDWKRAGLIGLCVAMAVHMSFDLFPARWVGFALIRVPFIGSLGQTSSVLWLLASVVACTYLALHLLHSRNELVLAGAIGLIIFMVASRVEQVFWPVLFVLMAAGWLASCFPNRHIHGQTIWRQLWQNVTRHPSQ